MKVELNDDFIRPAGKPDECFYCKKKIGEDHLPKCELMKIEPETGESPNGRIQWKGTNVCMDLYCTCGYHGHVDVEFFYHYKCPKCKTVFIVGAEVKLYPVPEHLIGEIGMTIETDETYIEGE